MVVIENIGVMSRAVKEVGDIEIHFVDSVVPGYFWIFPVNDEVANVGIGMVIGLPRKKKKKALQKTLLKTTLYSKKGSLIRR